MRILMIDHQGKGLPFAEALKSAGHEIVADNPDVLLIDHDSPPYYRRIINAYPDAKVVLYPHGAMSFVAWDGIWEVNERTAGVLVMGDAMRTAMEMYGYPMDVRAVGWPWSELQDFRRCEKVRNVLFAPIHPLNNGFLWEPARLANRNAFMALLGLNIALTVRYLGELYMNGIWEDPGVTYVQGEDAVSTAAEQDADVVVSHDTFAFMSIARGIPTVMLGQNLTPFDGYSDDDVRTARTWCKYANLLDYPYSAHCGNLGAQIERAARDEGALVQWRGRVMGPRMTPEGLNRALREIVDVA